MTVVTDAALAADSGLGDIKELLMAINVRHRPTWVVTWSLCLPGPRGRRVGDLDLAFDLDDADLHNHSGHVSTVALGLLTLWVFVNRGCRGGYR